MKDTFRSIILAGGVLSIGIGGVTISQNLQDISRRLGIIGKNTRSQTEKLEAAIRDSYQETKLFPEDATVHEFDGVRYMCVPVGYEGREKEED